MSPSEALYSLQIYPVPALTYIALVPARNSQLPVAFAPCRDRAIGPWRTRANARTPAGHAFLNLSFNGAARVGEFQLPDHPGDALPKALTDAVPGLRPAQLVRAVVGPARDALERSLARRLYLAPCKPDTWAAYRLTGHDLPVAAQLKRRDTDRYRVWL